MLGDYCRSRIFIKPGRTDFRKAINGLSGIIENQMRQDPLSGCYFVFCNKRKDRMKILYWDQNGFCLWYKRLEKDKFIWPMTEEDAQELSAEEFSWMLRGLDYRRAHKRLKYSSNF
jgi:transposase